MNRGAAQHPLHVSVAVLDHQVSPLIRRNRSCARNMPAGAKGTDTSTASMMARTADEA